MVNSEMKVRKQVTQQYYVPEDYDEVMMKLPDLIKQASIKAAENIVPTIYEKREVMEVIKKFIREKGRIVYGGTAVNEAIKDKNPNDAIYDNYNFSDLEFYSPYPVEDGVELANILYEKGYQSPVFQEANHDETYSLFVNYQLYSDITYVPKRIYNKIRTIKIDDVKYAHPHFILIDQLRIINQPLTSAEFAWEKTFKRMYLLQKYYPLEYFNKSISVKSPPDEIKSYQKKIKNECANNENIRESCLITGFLAYKYYIDKAFEKKEQGRMSFQVTSPKRYECNIPFIDIVSVNYVESVVAIYNYIKTIVVDPKKIKIDEYYPLFQFVGHMTIIKYDDNILIRITEGNNFCIPTISTRGGPKYVTYQYLLMYILINKFKAHLDSNGDEDSKNIYFDYATMFSNLVNARNMFLEKNKLGVINNTIFSDFKIACVGTANNFLREGKIRVNEKIKRGKAYFRYMPEKFFEQSEEAQLKFDPSKYNFKNTSGNKVTNIKKLLFTIDGDYNIVVNKISDIGSDIDDSSSESSGESFSDSSSQENDDTE